MITKLRFILPTLAIALPVALHAGATHYLALESTLGAKFNDYKARIASGMGYQPTMAKMTTFGVLEQVAERHHLPITLVQAVAETESGNNSLATSPKFAIGLMQVLHSNYKFCDLEDYTDLYNPYLNAECGAKILDYAINQSKGDISEALRIYNSGYNCSGKKRCRETEDYVQKVIFKAGKLAIQKGSD